MSDAARHLPVPTTTAEFLDWPGDGRAKHYELVDGVVRAMAPGSRTHAVIQANLALLIGNHLRRHWPACRLLITPGIVPRVYADRNFRLPGLGVTCSPDVKGQRMVTDPLLLAEVLSPSNRADTWMNVWAYCTLPSLAEVFIIDSEAVAGHVVRRGPEGHWPERPIELARDDGVRLESLDLSFPLSEAYEGTHLLG